MYETSAPFRSKPKNVVKAVVSAVVVIIVLSVVFSTFTTVLTGERGIVLRWGAMDRVLLEGCHMVNPVSEDVVIMEVRVQKYEVLVDSASKDLQTVTSTIALNFHLSPKEVGKLYSEIGTDYESRIVSPAIQESVKVGTANFTAEELISKRSAVKEAIYTDLEKRLFKFNIIADELNIVDFSFSGDFDSAIERKVTAEQDAFTAENKLKQVRFEADQKVATAEAEAKSSKLQADALINGAQVIELRKAEALLEFAKKWKGDVPATLFMGSEGSLPMFNIGK